MWNAVKLVTAHKQHDIGVIVILKKKTKLMYSIRIEHIKWNSLSPNVFCVHA